MSMRPLSTDGAILILVFKVKTDWSVCLCTIECRFYLPIKGSIVRSKYKGTLKKLQLKQFYGGCLPLSMTTNIQKVWGPRMRTGAVVLI